jgi:hypothetical protein
LSPPNANDDLNYDSSEEEIDDESRNNHDTKYSNDEKDGEEQNYDTGTTKKTKT